MNDSIGQELNIGDLVVAQNDYLGNGLVIGKILRFTPKLVEVKISRKHDKWGTLPKLIILPKLIYPEYVLKISDNLQQEIVFNFLKEG